MSNERTRPTETRLSDIDGPDYYEVDAEKYEGLHEALGASRERERHLEEVLHELLVQARTVEPIVREYALPITHDFLLAAIERAGTRGAPSTSSEAREG